MSWYARMYSLQLDCAKICILKVTVVTRPVKSILFPQEKGELDTPLRLMIRQVLLKEVKSSLQFTIS